MPKEPFEKQPLPVKNYVALVAALGAVGVTAALAGSGTPRAPIEHITIAMLASLVVELVPLEEVVQDSLGETSLSESIHLAAVAIFGYAPATLVGVASCAISEIARRRDWYKAVFNISMTALAILASGFSFHAVETMWHLPPYLLIVPIIAAALTYRLVGSSFLAGIEALKSGKPFPPALAREFSTDAIPFIIAVLMGISAAYLYRIKPAYSLLSVASVFFLSIAFRGARKLSAEVSTRKREFARAKEVQRNLMSMPLLDSGNLDIAFRYEPYDELSGDFFDIVQVGESLHFAIGDAMGKGTPAALTAAYQQGSLRLLLADRNAADTLRSLNRLIFDLGCPETFLSICCVRYQPREGLIFWSNAGHPPAILFKGDTGSVELLVSDGIALGAHPDATYSEHRAEFGKSDILVLYTDGVTEAADEERNRYGIERLIETVSKNKDLSAEDIVRSICESVERFTGRGASDDLTALVLKATKVDERIEGDKNDRSCAPLS